MFTRRRLLVLGLIVLGAAYLTAGGLGLPTENPTDGKDPRRSQMIQPENNGSYLWPYTSRSKTINERTLAINLIIMGDDDRVKRALTEQTSLDWKLADEPDNESADNETMLANDSNASEDDVGTLNNSTGDGNVTGPVQAPTPDMNESNETANATEPQPVNLRGTTLSWDNTHGSTRYTYIDARPAGGDAGWVREAYQIHAGTYFGSRYHIRAYTTPETEWTAVQIHREYFDWFRMRHTVVDIQRSRNVLESDFLGQPYVESVNREYYGIDRGWNDGWLSEIRLVPGLAAVLLMSLFTRETHQSLAQEGRRLLSWTRANVRGFILSGVLVALYLGVRSAGILFETTFPSVDPKLVFPVLYPVIALGLPILTFAFAQPFGATSRFHRLQRVTRHLGRPVEPLPAFGFAFVGLTAAFVMDFGGLTISSIPVQLVLHRVGLAVALGLIAAGSARIDERGAGLLVIGILGWVTGLVMPLIGYI